MAVVGAVLVAVVQGGDLELDGFADTRPDKLLQVSQKLGVNLDKKRKEESVNRIVYRVHVPYKLAKRGEPNPHYFSS